MTAGTRAAVRLRNAVEGAMSDRRRFLFACSGFLLVAGCAAPARRAGSGGGTQPGPAVPILGFQDWAAWVNRQPPPPDSMHVSGTVLLPSPGYLARLERLGDVGADQQTMVLSLLIEPRPGAWPDEPTPHDVSYSIDDYDGDHTSVAVLYRGARLTDARGNALQNIAIGEVF
jgi:hypothetical protein